MSRWFGGDPCHGDFVVCGTTTGHVLGIYMRKTDDATGVVRLCAEYEDDGGYKYRWRTVNEDWEDLPLGNILPVAHPVKGFYREGVIQYRVYCDRLFPHMGRWMTTINTRHWLYRGIKKVGQQRHLMAVNLAESTN